MSLLGIDVGTSGCKAAVFRGDGALIAAAYEEYDVRSPQPGLAELDSHEVWAKVRTTIARAVAGSVNDPVRALAVSSLGEALVPVTEDRRLLGPSILNYDSRGLEYVEPMGVVLSPEEWYAVTGNTLGNQYSLTKLMWLRDNDPALFQGAHWMLPWGSLVAYMLGAEAAVDWSLANRTLLFDVNRGDWSHELADAAGIDLAKLPRATPSGTAIGTVDDELADELGLPRGVAIVTGAHDQCANALGAGATRAGLAMYGMGTYACIVAPFKERRDACAMMALGLNTEHHAVPELFVSFMYNHSGSMLKWYRNTFAAQEQLQARALGKSVYPDLLNEMPAGPSGLLVLPHFAMTGPPEFITNSRGVILGLTLETPRGAITKAILEGSIYYLRGCVQALPPTGITIDAYRAVGGGSQSDAWVQLCADILDRPFERPGVTEAGTLGAAILAGVGIGAFATAEQGVEAMVHLDRRFEPRPNQVQLYNTWHSLYSELWPTLSEYLGTVVAAQAAL